MITHPNQIAEAIRSNPSYRGGPIQLVTCHGACGAPAELQDNASADHIEPEAGRSQSCKRTSEGGVDGITFLELDARLFASLHESGGGALRSRNGSSHSIAGMIV